jgi:hypothetical protein
VPAILFDIGWGALYGLLTYLSGSILPAAVLHVTADAMEYILAWKFPPAAPAPLVWATGTDNFFWVNCILAIVLGTVSIWAFRQLAHMRPHASAVAATGLS